MINAKNPPKIFKTVYDTTIQSGLQKKPAKAPNPDKRGPKWLRGGEGGRGREKERKRGKGREGEKREGEGNKLLN